MGTLGEVGALIVNTLGSLYLLAILLRFLLQLARADFYNPFVQAIVKITNHPIKELRRVIPGMWGIDFATLIYAFIVHCVMITLLFIFLAGSFPPTGILVTWAAVGLLSYVINIFYVSLLISIVSSFIAPYSTHPILVLTRQLTEPVMAPFRKLLPPMGGLDFSPIFLILSIMIIKTVIIEPAGMSAALVLGY